MLLFKLIITQIKSRLVEIKSFEKGASIGNKNTNVWILVVWFPKVALITQEG